MHNVPFTISQMLPVLMVWFLEYFKWISNIDINFSNVWIIPSYKNCQYCALEKKKEKREMWIFKN